MAAAGERPLRARRAERRGPYGDARPRQRRGARLAAREADRARSPSRASITSSGTTTSGSTTRRRLAGAGPNDGNFRHVAGLYAVLAALQRALSLASDRELLRRRQSARSRPDALYRRRLDGRSHVALGARPPQSAGADDIPAAGLPPFLPAARRQRADARRGRPGALCAQPHARRLRPVVPARQPRRDATWSACASRRIGGRRCAACSRQRARCWCRRRSTGRSPVPGTARCWSPLASSRRSFTPSRTTARSPCGEHAHARPRPHLRLHRPLGSRGRARRDDAAPA